jgi:hypothetical protein
MSGQRLHYPSFTLRQSLVIIWLIGLLCSIWFAPGKHLTSLFVPARSALEMVLSNQRPLLAVVEGNSVQIIDCRAEKIILRSKFKHGGAITGPIDFASWPSSDSVGASPWRPFGCNRVSAIFSPNDRFLSIRSIDAGERLCGITIIALSTSQQVTWISDPAVKDYPKVEYTRDGARIWNRGNVVAQLSDGMSSMSPEGNIPRARLDLSGLKVWSTVWNDQDRYLVSLFWSDETDFANVQADYFGPDQSEILFYGLWTNDAPTSLDIDYDRQLKYPNPFDAGSIYFIEQLVDRSHFVVGASTTQLPDRLGTLDQNICWNVKNGQIFKLPSWLCDVREHAGYLLINDLETGVFSINTQNGSRQSVKSKWRFGYFRESLLALWCVAWWCVTHGASEQDRSRWFGYLFATSTIVAIVPPSIECFGIAGLSRNHQWIFSIACLMPLGIGVLIAAIRRTVPIPLWIAATIVFMLLVGAWVHWGGFLQSQTDSVYAKLRRTLEHDMQEADSDLLRPWRFGIPKPDNIVHLEFRDEMKTTEVER